MLYEAHMHIYNKRMLIAQNCIKFCISLLHGRNFL